MSAESALGLLQEAAPGQPLDEGDALDLREALEALISHAPRNVVDAIGEALLAHEMDMLVWEPLEAARLVRVLIEHGSPSRPLTELSLNFLAMYFDELDDVIAECRATLAGPPEALAELSGTLTGAITTLEGI